MNLSMLNIGNRVAILAVLLSLTTALLGGMGWWALRADADQFQHCARTAAELQTAVDAARSAQVTFKIQIQEWKNTLLRGGDPAAFDKYSKAFFKEGDATKVKLAELRQALESLSLPTAKVNEAVSALDTLRDKYAQALRQYNTAEPDESAHLVDSLVKGMDRPPTQKLDAIVEDVRKASHDMQEASLQDAAARMGRVITVISAVLALSLTAGGAVSLMIVRSISVPLREAVHVATQVADGDLSVDIDASGRDEISQLRQAMGRMNASLRRVVSQVREAADTVSHASGEIATGNMDLSSRTELQASNLQQTVATIGHLSSGVQNSAEYAMQAETLASRASEVAERGGEVVGNVVQTMNDINASSRKISEIIGVIDGIAFQTNILALNAAVEAARAGEQGRGFAVVASEVRALAQRSANAAKEIKVLIHDSVSCVDRGAQLVGEAGETITSTVQAVRQVRDVVSEITVAAREQATSIGQVNQAITAIDNTMQQNAALVEEAAAAAASLNQQALALQGSVAYFRA